MSELKVDKITPRLGTTLTLGDAGDTINFGSGVLPNFENLTVTGDLTVDTNSLYVDSANNKVGIGTTSPDSYYSDQLVISCPAEGGVTLVSQGTTQASYLCFADGTTGNEAYRGYVRYSHNTDSLQFASAAAINMTIDSSGNVGIGTSSPSYTLQVDHQGSENVTVVAKGTAPGFGLYDTTTSAYNWALYNSNGDLTFYNTLNTNGFNSLSEKMRIDSSGNVGIGTSSPDNKLHIQNGDASASSNSFSNLTVESSSSYNILQFLSPNTASQQLRFGDPQDDGAGYIQFNHSDNSMSFGSPTERMRIDSSGRLLVGTTNITPASSNVNGFVVSNSQIGASRDGTVAEINRISTDGTLVNFRKDGSAVGSIGTEGGNLFLDGGSGKTGLRVANTSIAPRDNGSDTDGTVDFGSNTKRWKDFYLGGNIYLGGTGSANALDDYEKGTWTPRILFGGADTGNTYGAQDGTYVKVGNLITAGFFINVSSKGSATGTASISGLPFNAGGNGDRWGGTLSYYAGLSSVSGSPNLLIEPNGTSGALRKDGSTDLSNSNFNSGFSIYGVYIYTDQ